jgi:hypothetical protein
MRIQIVKDDVQLAIGDEAVHETENSAVPA